LREYAKKLSKVVESVRSRMELSLGQGIDFRISKKTFTESGFTSHNSVIKAVFNIPRGKNVKGETL